MKYFYKGGILSTLHNPEKTISIFQSTMKPLAFLQNNAQSHASLVGTDMSGTISRSANSDLSYGPYGYLPLKAMPALGLNGERCDPVTGHYMLGNGYRAYSTSLLRFISPDKDSPFARGGINSYAYVAGDPVNNIDPDGHGRGKILNLLKLRTTGAQATSRAPLARKAMNTPDYDGPMDNHGTIRTWSTMEAGVDTLNVLGHGKPGVMSGIIPIFRYDAPGLYNMLSEAGHNLHNRRVRFIVCNLATRPSRDRLSFAEEWTRLTGGSTIAIDGEGLIEPIYGSLAFSKNVAFRQVSPTNPPNTSDTPQLNDSRLIEFFIPGPEAQNIRNH